MATGEFENSYIKAWVDSGILFAEFKSNKIDLTAAKESVNMRMKMYKGEDYLVVIDATKVKDISKDARDYFASEEGSKYMIASALVVDSMVGKWLGNFFLTINKPNLPIRLFTTKQDALSWLKQFQTTSNP